METIKFLVQGSSNEPYEVTFYFDGQNMNALCTCQAGQNGQLCKHRLEILDGNNSKIVSPNKADSKKIVTLFKGTPLESKLRQLNEVEKELEFLKKKVELTKKELVKIMRGQ
jgi:uncharacterized Zn finger protein